MNAEKLLDAAADTIGARGSAYGGRENSFLTISEFWTVWLRKRGLLADGEIITSSDAAMMMGLMKVARIAGNLVHEDSYVDLAGYTALAAEITLPKPAEDTAESHATDASIYAKVADAIKRGPAFVAPLTDPEIQVSIIPPAAPVEPDPVAALGLTPPPGFPVKAVPPGAPSADNPYGTDTSVKQEDLPSLGEILQKAAASSDKPTDPATPAAAE